MEKLFKIRWKNMVIYYWLFNSILKIEPVVNKKKNWLRNHYKIWPICDFFFFKILHKYM